jgi:hypothetical protein
MQPLWADFNACDNDGAVLMVVGAEAQTRTASLKRDNGVFSRLVGRCGDRARAWGTSAGD